MNIVMVISPKVGVGATSEEYSLPCSYGNQLLKLMKRAQILGDSEWTEKIGRHIADRIVNGK